MQLPKIFSNFYVYWGVIVGSILGGTMLIWQVSEKLSSNVSLILVEDPAGTIVTNPLVPKLINFYVIFSILVVILLLVLLLIATIIEIRKANPELYELKQLRALYDDLLSFSKNVMQNFYDENDDLMRTDPKKIDILMIIETNGFAFIKREYDLYCPAKPAHMFSIWFDADDETPGIRGHREHRFRAKDLTRDREMDWIPTHDTLRRKEFIVFFPEMQPEETKTIEIKYAWPGYLNKLLKKGTVEFSWAHRSASPDTTAEMTFEWLFKSGFPPVRGKIRGNVSQTATLKIQQRDEGVAWVYHNPREILDKKNYRVLFELLSIDE